MTTAATQLDDTPADTAKPIEPAPFTLTPREPLTFPNGWTVTLYPDPVHQHRAKLIATRHPIAHHVEKLDTETAHRLAEGYRNR